MKDMSDAELLDGAAEQGFEDGFSLRLARGLARIAGGDLISGRDAFSLVFPRRLTGVPWRGTVLCLSQE